MRMREYATLNHDDPNANEKTVTSRAHNYI